MTGNYERRADIANSILCISTGSRARAQSQTIGITFAGFSDNRNQCVLNAKRYCVELLVNFDNLNLFTHILG